MVALAGTDDLVGAADVLADEADADHGDAHQEKQDPEQREQASLLGPDDETAAGEDEHE